MEDPRKAAELYLEQHKIPQLLEALTAKLLFSKPTDPKKFMVHELEKVKQTGTMPLLTSDDLGTMFGMFDIVNRGTVTVEQANNALVSVLGPGAKLEMEPSALLTREQFTSSMLQALKAAVPYRK